MFSDALVDLVNEPTTEQQKVLFFLLPAHVIGSGISWGFDDTEVRDNIHVFVLEHRDEVLAALLK